MHYSTHALLNCVALLSLLCDADAGRTPPPSEVLSHFARTIGTVLNPALSAELQRKNRSAAYQESAVTTRRQVDTRQISPQDAGANAGGAERNPGPAGGVGNLQFPGQGFPYSFERSYSYRYPPFNQQLSQNFYPGANAFSNQLLPNGLSFDPRFFQSQFGRNPQLPINQPGGVSKGVNAKLTAVSDGNAKETGNNNVNTLQNLESSNGGGGGSGDSKSSAQNNRPFDNSDFSSIPINPGQGGGGGGGNLGLDPSGGNLRVDNRYSGVDYERVRQNYYSDPPVNQRYYSSSFNEIPFSGGPPYRSSLSDRFSNLDFNGGSGAGRTGGASSDLRAGSGLGNPYFGNFFQGPYQSLNYNNLQGGGGGGAGVGGSPNGDGAPFAPENFDRGSQNFRSPFGLQYPNGFGGPGNGANFEGADGGANFGGAGGGNFGSAGSGNFGSAGGANFGGPASGNFGSGGGANFGGPGGAGDGGFGPGGPGEGGSDGIGGPGGDSGFFPGGGFGGEGDSSLRASSAKQSVARPLPAATESSEENRASLEQLEDRDESERIDREQKVRFVDGNEKRAKSEEKRSSTQK